MIVNQTLHIMTRYFSKSLVREKEYRFLPPSTNITKDEILKAIKKYFKDQTLDVITIYNPDTKGNQTLDEFVTYINTYGLGAWDTGQGDVS